MRTIAVINQKGGVGKTTTVANVSAALAMAGAKVAVIDLDPQAHLTIHFGLQPEQIELSTYHVLTQSTAFDDVLTAARENLYILPANIDLVGAETELVSVVGRETILREAIKHSAAKLDYIVIDCPPSLGLLTLNALAAVNEIIIPLLPHFLALQGLGKLLQTVDLVGKRINSNLKVTAILLCMFDRRTSLSSEIKADIEQFLNSARNTDFPWADAHIMPIQVRCNVKLAEAPSYGKTIFEYEQDCNGAIDYQRVAEYIQNPERVIAKLTEDNDQDTSRENFRLAGEPLPSTSAMPQGSTAHDDVSKPLE
ncbi:MAG: AAA family ATPase [Planctomycetota bacterium]